jgi:outer membrane protein assembly factor BamB
MRCTRSLVVLLLLAPLASAGEWPQWLGPNRDGTTTETVAAWKDAPKVLWKKSVGEGHSSPVVAGGKVFIHSKVKDKDEEEVVAYDAVKGEEAWRAKYDRGNFKALFGNGPRATPAVAGGKVYTLGITGFLTCFDAAKGEQVWQLDTLKEFNAKNLYFGVSGSPLVDDRAVYVMAGGKGAGIVALNKDKGDVLWRSTDDKPSYSSPIAIEAGGKRQLVFLTGSGVVALDPKDGTPFWQHALADLLNESATTPVYHGDYLFASTITAGGRGLKLGAKDGKPTAEEAWKNEELNCYFSTPVTVGKDYLYLVSGSKPLAKQVSATLRCVALDSGKELWKQEKVGKYHASLMRTGDDKLLMLDDSGNLILLEPNAKEYKELARAKVCGETWAHPALADGRLYVRDGDNLICLQMGN